MPPAVGTLSLQGAITRVAGIPAPHEGLSVSLADVEPTRRSHNDGGDRLAASLSLVAAERATVSSGLALALPVLAGGKADTKKPMMFL